MGSKLILLLGLLVGAFLTLTCVNENKTALSLKYNQTSDHHAIQQPDVKTISTSEPVQVVTNESKPVTVELSEPHFSYNIGDQTKLSANLASTDKTDTLEEFILTYCPADKCQQDLSFDKHTKEASWKNDALKIAAFLKDKNVKNGAISIEGNLFNIKGEVENEDDMNALNALLTNFDPELYKMENITSLTPKSEAIVQEVKAAVVATSIDKTQSEISALLKKNPIYFEFDSLNITTEGKEVLNSVIALLKDTGTIPLTVEGHTDAGGNDYYNKLLSQKRADSVKNYLLQNDDPNRSIEAIGYGEERPVSSNPIEKINRRVEIFLKRGE